jgi:hypothetical protein
VKRHGAKKGPGFSAFALRYGEQDPAYLNLPTAT